MPFEFLRWFVNKKLLILNYALIDRGGFSETSNSMGFQLEFIMIFLCFELD